MLTRNLVGFVFRGHLARKWLSDSHIEHFMIRPSAPFGFVRLPPNPFPEDVDSVFPLPLKYACTSGWTMNAEACLPPLPLPPFCLANRLTLRVGL